MAKDATVVVVGGALGAVIVGLGLYTVKALEVKRIVEESQTEMPQHELAQKIARMQADLTAFAEAYTEEVATEEATAYLVERLGITPGQMRVINRLSSVF